MDENQKTIERIKAWLDEYPKKRGVVVLFDEAKLDITDLANTDSHHAVVFATQYLKMVEDITGNKALIEELPPTENNIDDLVGLLNFVLDRFHGTKIQPKILQNAIDDYTKEPRS